MKRKAMAVLLTASMTAAVLSGCSSNKETEAPQTEAKTEAQTSAAAEAATEAKTEKATEAKTEKATEAKTEKATEAKTEKATEAKTEKATEAKTEKATEAKTEKATEAKTEKATEAVTEKATEAKTEKATEAVTEKATEAKTEKATEAATEAKTEKATEAKTEKATEAKTEKATEAVTEKATEAKTEKATEAVTEKATEAKTEKPTEAVTEKAAQTEEAATESTAEGMEIATEKETTAVTPAVMTYDEFMAAAVDDEVTVDTYVQNKQSWYEDKGKGMASIYTQNEEGAYFLYNMPISEEDYNKLEAGTEITVTGYKAEWSGEIEISDIESYEIGEGTYIAKPLDVTDLLSDEDKLEEHMNQYVSFTGMTVEASGDADGKDAAFLYNYDGSGSEGDDLYFNVSKDGATYTFTVESYLTDKDSDVYKAVENLKIGDVIDMTGYLYWYEGANPHIITVTPSGTAEAATEDKEETALAEADAGSEAETKETETETKETETKENGKKTDKKANKVPVKGTSTKN